MKFFKLNFSKKNEAGAIAIIGGASGQTAIYTHKRDEKKQKEHNDFLDFAAEKIIPCNKTIIELEEYITNKYGAKPHTLSEKEVKVLKANVILNYFNDVIHKPEPLKENPTKKELIEYYKKDTSFRQAREYPEEKLGLVFKAYKLTNVEYKTRDENNCSNINFEDEVVLERELKTEYINLRNGSQDIIHDLLLYKGVSEKDIMEKSPRFIAYAYTLRYLNKI